MNHLMTSRVDRGKIAFHSVILYVLILLRVPLNFLSFFFCRECGKEVLQLVYRRCEQTSKRFKWWLGWGTGMRPRERQSAHLNVNMVGAHLVGTIFFVRSNFLAAPRESSTVMTFSRAGRSFFSSLSMCSRKWLTMSFSRAAWSGVPTWRLSILYSLSLTSCQNRQQAQQLLELTTYLMICAVCVGEFLSLCTQVLFEHGIDDKLLPNRVASNFPDELASPGALLIGLPCVGEVLIVITDDLWLVNQMEAPR